MFCEIGRERAEVFVRDEGPGFIPDDVASERRGIRDAMIGRMAVSGGRATIESAPGEGTEVALMLASARRRAMSDGAPDAGTVRRRIVVVDDHHLFRAGVPELAAHCDVVGEAADPAQALVVIATTRPDVVLLDVPSARRRWRERARGPARPRVATTDPPAVLALSVSDAAADVVPMIRAGALGYVTKTIDTERAGGGDRAGGDRRRVLQPAAGRVRPAGSFSTPVQRRRPSPAWSR